MATDFGTGAPIVVKAAGPAIATPGRTPIVVAPVPGPGGGVDLDVDEYGKYILDCGGPANTNGA